MDKGQDRILILAELNNCPRETMAKVFEGIDIEPRRKKQACVDVVRLASLLEQGKTDQEIAEALDVCIETARRRRREYNSTGGLAKWQKSKA